MNIWLDCDPGHDDMMAIILASCSPALRLRGISATHGNQTVQKTFVNAVRTTFLTGVHTPVFQGFAEPLTRESKACPEIHGESGLGGVDWKEVDELMRHAKIQDVSTPPSICDFFNALKKEIDDFCASHGGKFTIVTTASFTNIAQFLKAFPGYAEKIKIVAMAGNFKVIGNIGAWAEFNVLIDPEAVQYCIDKGVHITYIPLDVTHTVLFTPEIKNRILALQNPKLSKMIVSLLEFFKETYKTVFGFDSPPLHDPVAVFYLLHPELFKTEDVNVVVETKGEHTFGACCADWFKQFGRPVNATVCLKVDVEAFWNEMIKALEIAAAKGGLQ